MTEIKRGGNQMRRKKYSISEIILTVWFIALMIAIPVTFTAAFITLTMTEVQLNIDNWEETKVIEPMEKESISVQCTNIEWDDSYSTKEEEETNKSSILNEVLFPVEKPVINLEKYATVIEEWSNKHSDFGEEQLTKLYGYCTVYNVPMELMLAVISVESSFESTALSDYSTASGYCQIVRNTAKWIYEDQFELGTYDVFSHEYIMTNDWDINLQMGVYLLRYNADQNYGSWEYAIHDYHGSTDPENNKDYFDAVNQRLYSMFGISMHELEILPL